MTPTTADKVALVTGASRGIGRATSVALARKGFDLVLTARTVDREAGEEREHSPTANRSDTRPVPGSLKGTAQLVEAEGRSAVCLPADLTDRADVEAMGAAAVEAYGQIDVLVNNARFTGPGHMDRLLETPMRYIDQTMEANYYAPLMLCRAVLPGMLERGRGFILNVTSGAAYRDPPAAPGQGWSSANYASSKAALFRVALYLAVEHGGRGIFAANIDPGLVVSERVALETAAFGVDLSGGGPPESIAEAIAWLVTSPEAAQFNGRRVVAQRLCHEQGLLAGWSGPQAYMADQGAN